MVDSHGFYYEKDSFQTGFFPDETYVFAYDSVLAEGIDDDVRQRVETAQKTIESSVARCGSLTYGE